MVAAPGTTIDPRSAAYRTNRDAMADQWQQVADEQAKVLEGGGEKYVLRHRDRGRLPRRERTARRRAGAPPSLGVSPLAGGGTGGRLGGGIGTGSGRGEGIEGVVSANAPTVGGGTSSPTTVAKG